MEASDNGQKPKKGTSSPLHTAVRDFAKALEEGSSLDGFAAEYMDAAQRGPMTIRGTGDVGDRTVRDPHFQSHEILHTPSWLVELGVMKPDELVELPFLQMSEGGKPHVRVAGFMGNARSGKAQMIPADIQKGPTDMKKMADFILQNPENSLKFAGVLDLIKALHYFQQRTLRHQHDEVAIQAIGDLDAVFELIECIPFGRTESLIECIYQKLFERPKIKALIEKLQKVKIDIRNASDLQNWVETDGFSNPKVTDITTSIKEQVESQLIEQFLDLKKSILEFVHGLRKKKARMQEIAKKTVAETANGVAGQAMTAARIVAAAKAAPPPIVRKGTIIGFPAPWLPGAVADEELDAEARKLAIKLVNQHLTEIGVMQPADAPVEPPPIGKAPLLLKNIFDELLEFRAMPGRTITPIGFPHKFEFCECLFDEESPLGEMSSLPDDWNWDVINKMSLTKLFNTSSEEGLQALLKFLKTVKKFRDEIRTNGLTGDDEMRAQCAEIFKSLFS